MNSQLHLRLPALFVFGLLLAPGSSALGQTLPDSFNLITPKQNFDFSGGSQQVISGTISGSTPVSTILVSVQTTGGTTNWGSGGFQYTGGMFVYNQPLSNPGVNKEGMPIIVSATFTITAYNNGVVVAQTTLTGIITGNSG